MNRLRHFFQSCFDSLTPRGHRQQRTTDVSDDDDDEEEEEEEEEDDDEDDEMVAEVFEHERFIDGSGWSARNLSKRNDPGHFISSMGASPTFPSSPPLVNNWSYTGKWRIDNDISGVMDGWVYGYTFDDIEEGHVIDPTSKRGKKKPPQVRRKRWIRTVIPTKPSEASQAEKNNTSKQEKKRVSSTRNNQGSPEDILLFSNEEAKTNKHEGKKDKKKETSIDKTVSVSKATPSTTTATPTPTAAAAKSKSDGTTNKTVTRTSTKGNVKTGTTIATTTIFQNDNVNVEEGDEDGTGAKGVDIADFEVDSDQG